jgi:hypothetical protein
MFNLSSEAARQQHALPLSLLTPQKNAAHNQHQNFRFAEKEHDDARKTSKAGTQRALLFSEEQTTNNRKETLCTLGWG